MSFLTNTAPPSLNMKGGEPSTLTIEAERDNYRQRYSNMTLIMKELQQQLAQYKVRCAGVDTLAVVLKEAKQESVTLARQKKALETAVANLQNRLSTNGLSASVNIEETDMYVPGTSKQTLDNLARENARLRGLLKSTEYHAGKKTSEDTQELKALVEDLESGKNQLQAQLQEVEGIKMTMVRQYEEAIASLKESIAAERLEMQKEVDIYKKEVADLLKNSEKDLDKDCIHPETRSIETQTARMEAEMVASVRKCLKDLTQECMQLDETLENLRITGTEQDAVDAPPEKQEPSGVTTEVYQELREKLQEVTLMNQRWQVHNDTRERQHISNLAELKNEIESSKQQADLHKGENKRLVMIVEELQSHLNQLRQRPQIDHSIVEILKQQIQVCTEDFNNERKDHEQVIKRNKSLLVDMDVLKAELNRVKQERDNLKLQLESNVTGPQLEARQPQARHSWWGGQYQQAAGQTNPADFPDIPQFPPVGTLDTSKARRTRSDAAPLQQAGPTMRFQGEAGPSHLYTPSLPHFRPPVASSPTYTPSNLPQSQFAFEGDAGPSNMYALPAASNYAHPESSVHALEGGGTGSPQWYPTPGMNDPRQFVSYSAPNRDPAAGGKPEGSVSRQDPMASMPVLKRRCSDADMLKNHGVMSCFKCGKEFPDDQTEQLLKHINACKD